jgi:hypothetical protein
MGKLIAIVNNTGALMFIGDRILAPGDCRHFDEDLVPEKYRPKNGSAPAPAPAPKTQADEFAAVLGCTVEEIQKPEDFLARIAAVEDPGLITRLVDLELARDVPRDEVLGALDVRQLELADKFQAEQEARAQADAAEAAAKAHAEEAARLEAEPPKGKGKK